MSSDIAQRAIGRWRGMLPLLGIDSKFLSNRHGPCPMCGGKDRWRFDDKRGVGSWFCTHCGSGDGFTLICKAFGWSFPEAAKRVEGLIGTVHRAPQQRGTSDDWARRVCRETWGGASHVKREDPVTRYLDQRGLDEVKEFPKSLRSAPACRFQQKGQVEHHPAMLAQIVTAEGAAVGLHRTYLDDVTFTKLPIEDAKRMFGQHPPGSAVRLGQAAAIMGIAEGIETAMAASALWKVATWAALTADRLMTWVPPEGVQEVFVFADNDLSYTGHATGYGLARKLHTRGIKVRVCMPEEVGDWNDALLAERGARK